MKTGGEKEAKEEDLNGLADNGGLCVS